MPIALAVSQIDGPFPGAGDLAALTILTGAAIYYDLTERIYLTYTLTNDAGQVYVGRTSGFGSPYSIMMRRYYGHHMRIFGFKNPTIDKYIQGLNAYGAIRGREQQLIDFYGGIGNPRVANKIRGVSKLNVLKGRSYHEMSNFFFGNIAPYTGY